MKLGMNIIDGRSNWPDFHLLDVAWTYVNCLIEGLADPKNIGLPAPQENTSPQVAGPPIRRGFTY